MLKHYPFLRKLWHDPVWSKVIAAIITGAPGLIAKHFGWFSTSIPLWLVLLLVIPAITLSAMFSRSFSRRRAELEPDLLIDFEGNESNIIHAEHTEGGKLISLIYVRVRVQNRGTAVAKNCQVYLTGLREVHPGGGITTTTLEDSKLLAWAGWKFTPVDIPPAGGKRYADVMTVSKNAAGWRFSVEHLFSHQQKLKAYVGTYRFGVMAVADNAAASSFCEIDVTYNGDWHSLRAVAVAAPIAYLAAGG